MNTEQILDHIREVCGLKRLEFGCEIIYYHEPVKYVRYGVDSSQYGNGSDGHHLLKHDGIRIFTSQDNFEIIGLPVHLEHLLYTIYKSNEGRVSWKRYLVSQDGTILKNGDIVDNSIKYDYTKTVEQNLNENAELRELITNLIK